MRPRDRDYRVLTWILIILAVLVIGSWAMVMTGVALTRGLGAALERLHAIIGAALSRVAQLSKPARASVDFPAIQSLHKENRA